MFKCTNSIFLWKKTRFKYTKLQCLWKAFFMLQDVPHHCIKTCLTGVAMVIGKIFARQSIPGKCFETKGWLNAHMYQETKLLLPASLGVPGWQSSWWNLLHVSWFRSNSQRHWVNSNNYWKKGPDLPIFILKNVLQEVKSQALEWPIRWIWCGQKWRTK